MSAPVVLVGCGKMGGALLSGWRDRAWTRPQSLSSNHIRKPRRRSRERHGVSVVSDPESLTADVRPEAVVFAVKPQNIDAVVPAYAALVEINPDTAPVFLSVAAGRTIASIARVLGV